MKHVLRGAGFFHCGHSRAADDGTIPPKTMEASPLSHLKSLKIMRLSLIISLWLLTNTALQADDLNAVIQHASEQTGVPVIVIKAVIRQESNGKRTAVSHKGAQGLMQLMPATAQRFGVTQVFDPQQNILAGSRYLAWLYRRFGNWSLALAGYNAGEGVVDRYGGIPPYRETQHYVERILAHIRQQQAQPLVLAKAVRPPATKPMPQSKPLTVVPQIRAAKLTPSLNTQRLKSLSVVLSEIEWQAMNATTAVQWEPPDGYYGQIIIRPQVVKRSRNLK